MNKWSKLKTLYTKDHLSKKLAQPKRRLNALECVEEYLKQAKPDIITDPLRLSSISKDELKEKLAKHKGRALSAAEESVINGLYKFLPFIAN